MLDDLSLVIRTNKEWCAENVDIHEFFKTYQVFLKHNNSSTPLYQHNQIKNVSDLNVLLKNAFSKQKITLPYIVKQNLLTLLKKPNLRLFPTFCCVDFINFLFGQLEEKNTFSVPCWDIYEISSTSDLTLGDAIYLSKGNQITHFALYISDNVYLSLFGTNGPLIITSLGEIKKGFDGNSVYKISPKNPKIQSDREWL